MCEGRYETPNRLRKCVQAYGHMFGATAQAPNVTILGWYALTRPTPAAKHRRPCPHAPRARWSVVTASCKPPNWAKMGQNGPIPKIDQKGKKSRMGVV